MSADEFRSLVLTLPEASEAAHMGHPDFRVRGKIFATLGPDEAWGMVKLTPEQQARFVQVEPSVFQPVNGAWGRRGCTFVQLEAATEPYVRAALTIAFRNKAPKRLAQKLDEDNKHHVTADAQAAAEQKYAGLKKAIKKAGFFPQDVRVMKDYDHLVCCGKHSQSLVLPGMPIWVAEVHGQWFITTPHPYCYRVQNPRKIAKVVIAYLGRRSNRKDQAPTGDVYLYLANELVEIGYDEFVQVIRGTGPGVAPGDDGK